MPMESESRKRNLSTKIIYNNGALYSPDGILLCRCNKSKLEWYVSNGLAGIISVDPFAVKLLFQPKALGHVGDDYHLQDMLNKCCVCGENKFLTRHHVVPWCYRRYFAVFFAVEWRHYKRDHHDILPVCIECHRQYEDHFGDSYRRRIATEYNAPLNGVGFYEDYQNRYVVTKLARTILKYNQKIPPTKMSAMIDRIEKRLGHKPDKSELEILSARKLCPKSEQYKSHGELVVSSIRDLNLFVQSWRRHFTDAMKPKYMPSHWFIDRLVTSCNL